MIARFICVLSLSLCLVSSMLAQTLPAPEAAPSASWVFTGSAVSQYMFRGTRFGGPSFQPSVEFDYGALAAGVWASTPLKDKVPGQSDPEFDLYASYKLALSETLNLQPGFTWYTFPDANQTAGFYRSTFEPSLALNYTVAGIAITPKIYYDVVMKGPTYELTAAYALPLKQIGSELDFIATAGTFRMTDCLNDASPAVKNWGDYWLAGVSLPYQVTKNSKLTLGFAYTEGSGNYFKAGSAPKFSNPLAVGRGVATITYSMTY